MSSSSTGTFLLPTDRIADPQVRAFLDRLSQVWDERNDGEERFVSVADFNTMVGNAISEALSGTPNGANPIGTAIDDLSESIRKSILYQTLSNPIPAIDLAALRQRVDEVIQDARAKTSELQNGIVHLEETITTDIEALSTQLDIQISRIDDAEAAIISEATTRATADTALTNALSVQVSRIDDAEAAITTETSTRSTKDNALAAAINNMWASIGGSTAVIADSSLASVTPSAATATKWNQVVASVTDPNTGLVSSAAILQETRTYANNANSTLNAIYSVRAEVSSGGGTVVGGFGLAATSGAGSSQGPTIDFGVLANKFWIGAPASGYNPATEFSSNLQFPFIVVSTPTVIGGATYQPGVYIKHAFIDNLDATRIKAGSITTDRLVVGAVTAAAGHNMLYNSMAAASGYLYGSTVVGLTSTGTPVSVTASINISAAATNTAIAYCNVTSYLVVDGVMLTNMFSTAYMTMIFGGGGHPRRGFMCLPLVVRGTVSAAYHNYSINTYFEFRDASGNIVSPGSGFCDQYVSMIVTENKV